MQHDGRGRCSGTNKDGAACSGVPLPGKDRCAWHDPAMRERVAAGRVQGGRAKSNANRATKQLPKSVLTATEFQGLVCVVATGVVAGKLPPGVGAAVASLARAYKDLAEVGRLEDQVAELEALVRGRSA